MTIRRILLPLAALAVLAGCAPQPKSDIGLVDLPRLMAYWPKFQNYNNQITADQLALRQSRASNADKQKQFAQLQDRYVRMQTEVTTDVQSAAQQVASEKHLRFVFTRQYVGYGGVDITPDVEKKLNITETSPKP